MKQCLNGHAVSDDTKFCPTCGAEIVDNYENAEEEFESSVFSNKKKIFAVVMIVLALLGVGLWLFGSTWSSEKEIIETEEEKPVFDSVLVINEKIEIEEIPIDTLEMLARALNSQSYQSVSLFHSGFAVVCKNGKYGIIDKCGNEIVSCLYDEVDYFCDGLAKVKKDGAWGFVDSLGVEIIPCVYENESYVKGVIQVKRNGKWELVNKKGQILADLGNSLDSWCNEGAVFIEKDGKRGFVNYQGKEIVPCVYDVVEPFSGGIAAVKKDGKWGFVNNSGNVVIPIVYDFYISSENNEAILVEKDGSWGMLDNSNNEIAPFIYSKNPTSGYDEFSFYDGFDSNRIEVSKDGKGGLLDITGKEITPFIYDYIDARLHEGYTSVTKDGKCGYIDINGNEVVPCKYEMTYFPSDGLFPVRENKKWGLVDNQGNEIIPCVYDSHFKFSEGLAAVERNGLYGYIDMQGNVVIDFVYGSAEAFNGGFAKVGTKKYSQDGGYVLEHFYIDKNGREREERITYLKGGLMIVRPRNGKCGIVDKNFNEIVPCIYDAIDSGSLDDELFLAKKNGKYGFINSLGQSTFDYYTDNPETDRNIEIHEKEALMKGIVDYLNERSNYGSIVTSSNIRTVTKAQNGLWQASVTLTIGDDLHFFDINDIAFNLQMGKVYSAKIIQKGFMPGGAVNTNYGYDVTFRNSDDVWEYVRTHKFKANTGTVLVIRGTNMYFNDMQVANGLRVEFQQGLNSQAYLTSSNANLWVNGSSHYIQNMIDGYIYREVK